MKQVRSNYKNDSWGQITLQEKKYFIAFRKISKLFFTTVFLFAKLHFEPFFGFCVQNLFLFDHKYIKMSQKTTKSTFIQEDILEYFT